MDTIKITTLNNGLRVITDTVSSVHSVALGIWVGVGTRDEDLQHNGVAHMVEHMLFKGTQRRGPKQIAEEVENVGGHMNAYTSKEMTSYHIHLLKNDLPLALDMLADMYQNATLPEEEIARERQVILQEIGMTNDTPDDLIFDNYYETAYPGQGLGAPILGRAQHVAQMQRGEMADYIHRFYTPGRTIISAAGDVDHDSFVQQVAQTFGNLPADKPGQHAKARYEGGEHRQDKELEQTHIVLGFQGLSRLDDDYLSARILAMMLGGGMSSRLFQEVREKRGLVYTVYAYHSGYIDDGQFGIYAGTGPTDLPELMPVLCDEILKTTHDLTEAELNRARAQIKSGMVIGRESMMARAEQQAKYLQFHGHAFDMDALLKKIDAITVADIQRTAKRIFATRPTLAALGPIAALESYDKICARLAV